MNWIEPALTGLLKNGQRCMGWCSNELHSVVDCMWSLKNGPNAERIDWQLKWWSSTTVKNSPDTPCMARGSGCKANTNLPSWMIIVLDHHPGGCNTSTCCHEAQILCLVNRCWWNYMVQWCTNHGQMTGNSAQTMASWCLILVQRCPNDP